MKFRSELTISKAPRPITHRDQTLLIGSCFTENMGDKMSRHAFRVMENPHGILFNPVSVAEALTQYIDHTQATPRDIFCYQDIYHSWKHHSRFSDLQAENSLAKINQSVSAAHAFLKTADHVLITLGSAWVYTLTAEAIGGQVGSVAANNHKAPAAWFRKRLLTVEETLSTLDNIIHRLFHFNPKLQIIFTISPVRHLREGMIENNRSKAVLIQAVHHLVDKFEGLYYFPAYELVIDDLRDYRFYAEDLVHPNYQATQYVWEKFTEACMTDETRELLKEIAAIQSACTHKPFNPHSLQHQQFRANFLAKAKYLQEWHPYINLQAQIRFLSEPDA